MGCPNLALDLRFHPSDSVGGAFKRPFPSASKTHYTGFSRLGGLWLYQYDDLGQVTSGKKFTASGQEIPGQQFSYSFDDIGNRLTSTNSPQVDYASNDLNQYVSRTVPGEFTLSGKTESDASMVAIQNENTGQAFKAQRLENYFYVPQSVDNSDTSYLIDYKVTALDLDDQGQETYSTQNLDVHIPQNPEQFTYDPDGNLTSDARWNYQWDAENRRKSQVTRDMWDHFGDIDYAKLAEADLPDSAIAERGDLIATYKYDYQSRRTEKKVWKFHVEEGEPGTGGEIPMITQIREKLAETIARIEERRDNAIAHIQAKVERIQNSHMPQRVKDKLIRQLERQIERETAKADQQIAHETEKAERRIAHILEHSAEMIAKLQEEITQVEEWRDRHVECIQSVIDWLNEHRDELEDGNGHHGRKGKHGWGKKRDILMFWKRACDHGHGHWKKRWKHGKKCGDLPLFPHFIGFHCGRDWDVDKLIELLQQKIALINELADKRIAKLQAKIDSLTGGGTEPTEPMYEWRLTRQRFAYDANNVVAVYDVESETDETTGETVTSDVLSQTMLWGEDLSGSLDGAGGVGGLLAVTLHSTDDEGSPVEKAYLPVYDGNGNVMGYVDGETGEEVAEFEYSPFGKLKVDTDSEGLFVFRFSTKMYDKETGTVHYRYRDYDPEMGRWLSRDKVQEIGGLNVYSFVRNDSINRKDNLGNIPLDTLLDLGFLTFDVVVGAGPLVISMDVAALLVPYVPNVTRLGHSGRILRSWDEVPDIYKYTRTSGAIEKKFVKVNSYPINYVDDILRSEVKAGTKIKASLRYKKTVGNNHFLAQAEGWSLTKYLTYTREWGNPSQWAAHMNDAGVGSLIKEGLNWNSTQKSGKFTKSSLESLYYDTRFFQVFPWQSGHNWSYSQRLVGYADGTCAHSIGIKVKNIGRSGKNIEPIVHAYPVKDVGNPRIIRLGGQ